MFRYRLVIPAFVLIILLSLFIRMIIISEKHILKYDDSLSYLMATGHTGAYQEIRWNELSPIGQWVKANQWKKYIVIEEANGFQQIADDLAQYDLHPPLYFWLLHIWLKYIGITYWTGPLLNVIVDIIVAVVLFFFANRYLNSRRLSLLVSAVWLLSPIAIQSTSWIRQYSLFTLVGLLFVFGFYAAFFSPSEKPSWAGKYLILVGIVTIGLLTHYQFTFFILIGSSLIFLKNFFFQRNIGRLVRMTIILAVAGLLFFIVFPNFFTSFTSYSPPLPAEANPSFRLKRTIYIGGLLFSPLILGLALSMIGYLVSATRDSQRSWIISSERIPTLLLWIFGFTTALWGLVSILYLVGFSPQHAMGAKYVSFITPHVALLTVLVLMRMNISSKTLLILLLTIMVILSFSTTLPAIRDYFQNRLDVDLIQSADVIVLDNINAGSWVSVMLYINDESDVFAATQPYLYVNPELWLPRFCSENAIYVSFIRGEGTSEEGHDNLVDLINKECKIILLSETWKPLGTIRIYGQPVTATSYMQFSGPVQ